MTALNESSYTASVNGDGIYFDAAVKDIIIQKCEIGINRASNCGGGIT